MFLWLQEFISREYLAGSTGKVAPPILSRLYQFTSDGMIGYNQARKVAYIPFPFPHAQITSLFVFVVVCFMPVLVLSYLDNKTFGFLINMLIVMSFTGLHEVARELESPFVNAPNDVPLNWIQAQFNESLMTMFYGYHPDAYWEVCHQDYPMVKEKANETDQSMPLTSSAASNTTVASGKVVTQKPATAKGDDGEEDVKLPAEDLPPAVDGNVE